MATRIPQAPEILVMHPDEDRLRYAEFADDLETGESLTGSPTAAEIDTSDLTITNVAIDGTKVNLRIDASGATENTLYRIKITVATDQSNTIVLTGRVYITSDEGDTQAS